MTFTDHFINIKIQHFLGKIHCNQSRMTNEKLEKVIGNLHPREELKFFTFKEENREERGQQIL